MVQRNITRFSKLIEFSADLNTGLVQYVHLIVYWNWILQKSGLVLIKEDRTNQP